MQDLVAGRISTCRASKPSDHLPYVQASRSGLQRVVACDQHSTQGAPRASRGSRRDHQGLRNQLIVRAITGRGCG